MPRPRLVPTPLRSAVLLVLACLFGAACVGGIDADVNVGEEAQTDVEAEAETVDQEDEEGDGSTAETDGATSGDGAAGGDLPVGALAAPAELAGAETVPCSFDELVPLPVTPTCWQVTVPEDWNDPDPADQVILQAAVFEGDGSSEDPIIYFDGGPGGHTLDSLSFTFSALIQPFLADRDYIVFDQRGLGVSEPSLACPEVTELALEDIAGRLDPDSASGAQFDAQEGCRDRLVASGVNLEAYNSIASANDVEAMRTLLGYDRLNVIGISYGTRLAQSYMRMYPDSLRSVVLDSIFPTGYDLWSNFDPGAIRAFEQLFDGCAASAECSQAFPRFEERFFQLLDQLDDEPISLEAGNLITGEAVPMEVNGDDVMGLVFSALYDRSQFAVVPQLVEDGLAGDYETIELFGSILVTNLEFVSHGMRLSVECNEEIPFESEATLEANRPDDPRYARLADQEGGGLTLFDLCQAWPAGTAPEVESLLVDSEVPALLLAGQYDPITPPAGVDAVAAGLSTAYSFLLPHEGHGIAPTDCGADLVRAFLADPDSEPDGSCIAASPEPAWTPSGDGSPVELVEFEVDGLISIRGLRPDGWTDAGNGVFARQETAVDPTTLLIQPTNGLAAETLVDLLANQLDLSLSAGDPLELDGVTWATFQSGAASSQAVRVAVSPGPDGILVLLVTRDEEIDFLYDQLFEPVAVAAATG